MTAIASRPVRVAGDGQGVAGDLMERALLAIVRLFVNGHLVYRDRREVEVRRADEVGAAAARLRRTRVVASPDPSGGKGGA